MISASKALLSTFHKFLGLQRSAEHVPMLTGARGNVLLAKLPVKLDLCFTILRHTLCKAMLPGAPDKEPGTRMLKIAGVPL